MRVRLVIGLLLSVALASAGAVAAEPQYGGRVVIAIGVEPESLDPIGMSSAPAATVSEHISQPLIYLDVDGTLQPSLAVDWEASEDGKVWTLYLREGVTFHDGTPFDAEAVKMNLDRFLDPESGAPFRFLIERVTEVEVAGEYMVKLHTDEPFAPMLAHLSHSFIAMVSPEQLRGLEPGDPITHPIGTGPFTLERWDRGEQVILKANEDYWGDRPYLDEVVFKFVPEDSARVIMLETGEADAIMRVPPLDVQRLEAHAAIDVVHATSVRVIYIGFNNLQEPFTDVRVRQALNYAIDKQEIVDVILGGAGEPSTAPIVPAVFGHYEAGPYEYNPEKAQELLEDAGYPDGFSATLYHPTGRYMMDATIAETVQSFLMDIGIDAELITMEWAAYLAHLQEPPETADYDMYMLGWGTVTLDADYGLYALLHSSQWPPAGWAVGFYKNAAVDAALDLARVTPPLDVREALYETAVKAIWHDAPWLYLHDEVQINAVREGIHGLIHHPLENISAWEAWIDR